MVGALKSLGIREAGLVKFKPTVVDVLASLGQVLFDPPSVGVGHKMNIGYPHPERWHDGASHINLLLWATFLLL